LIFQEFLILKVTISGWGDYDLVSYKAIPIRADASYRYLTGPSEIIYNASGYADYYKQSYQLWTCPLDKVNVEYDVVSSGVIPTVTSTTWTLFNPYKEDDNLIGTISPNGILKPASFYAKDVENYGVKASANVVDGEEKIVWI
jgi:hypothetical protein